MSKAFKIDALIYKEVARDWLYDLLATFIK